MKLLLYCTKNKPYLLQGFAKPMHTKDTTNPFNYKWCLIEKQTYSTLNGKIVAECDFEVEKITSFNLVDFEKESCVDRISMFKYLKTNLIWDNKFEILLNTFGSLTLGYAIHIKNLHIFNGPKELSDYYSIHDIGGMLLTDKLKKAPQNMQRVSIQDWEYGTANPNDLAILISIRPEWLCKILNGEKTIEVRKKVLKGMLNNERS